MVDLEDGIDPDNPAQTCADARNKHRQPGFSKPAHHAAHNLHQPAQEIEAAEPVQTDEPVADHVFISRISARNVDAEQLSSKQETGQAQRKPDHQNRRQAGGEHLFDAVDSACAEILAGEGDGSVEDGIHCRVDKALNAGSCGVCRNDACAEGVDRALHKHVCDAEQRTLQTRRKTDLNHAQRLFPVQPDAFQLQMAQSLASAQAAHDEEK